MTTLHVPDALTHAELAQPLSIQEPPPPYRPLDVGTPAPYPRHAKASQRSSPEGGTFDIGAFEFARKFVEHLVVIPTPPTGLDGSPAHEAVDWETLTASVGDAPSLEVAIGRAIVAADRLARERASHVQVTAAATPSGRDDPFFSFTVADVEPDFGDDRYRSRVAKRVAGIMGTRHETEIPG